MSQHETKTVLGRVFKWDGGIWKCETKHGSLHLWDTDDRQSGACLIDGLDEMEIATGYGPTESDAILALQSTLRKMAELEVVGG